MREVRVRWREEHRSRCCCLSCSVRQIDVRAELAQLLVPCTPLQLRGEETISHVAEKFHLHNMHIFHWDGRDFSPSFVGVGVVIQELVSQHQCNSHELELAIWAAFDVLVESLELVDEQ